MNHHHIQCVLALSSLNWSPREIAAIFNSLPADARRTVKINRDLFATTSSSNIRSIDLASLRRHDIGVDDASFLDRPPTVQPFGNSADKVAAIAGISAKDLVENISSISQTFSQSPPIPLTPPHQGLTYPQDRRELEFLSRYLKDAILLLGRDTELDFTDLEQRFEDLRHFARAHSRTDKDLIKAIIAFGNIYYLSGDSIIEAVKTSLQASAIAESAEIDTEEISAIKSLLQGKQVAIAASNAAFSPTNSIICVNGSWRFATKEEWESNPSKSYLTFSFP